VEVTRKTRAEIVELSDLFGGEVIAAHDRALVIQLVGEQEQVASFLDLMKPFRIVDVSRSGVIAMGKE
jgi:acetolactate synthase-1/3 small subunit